MLLVEMQNFIFIGWVVSEPPGVWKSESALCTGNRSYNFELGREYCTIHPPQVSSFYVYSFRSYHVDKQTNNIHRQI